MFYELRGTKIIHMLKIILRIRDETLMNKFIK
jgi:hypothetical protein